MRLSIPQMIKKELPPVMKKELFKVIKLDNIIKEKGKSIRG